MSKQVKPRRSPVRWARFADLEKVIEAVLAPTAMRPMELASTLVARLEKVHRKRRGFIDRVMNARLPENMEWPPGWPSVAGRTLGEFFFGVLPSLPTERRLTWDEFVKAVHEECAARGLRTTDAAIRDVYATMQDREVVGLECTNGYVEKPERLEDFVSASTTITKYAPHLTLVRLKRLLESGATGVRWHMLDPHRLMVHEGDWIAHGRRKAPVTLRPEASDNPEEVAERKAASDRAAGRS